jgi:hypothetical protein
MSEGFLMDLLNGLRAEKNFETALTDDDRKLLAGMRITTATDNQLSSEGQKDA